MVRIIPKHNQARGMFNNGQIIENKPIGFPQDGGFVRPYSNLFYWAHAEAVVDSTIPLHPHKGFEILSFVIEGSGQHFDTKNEVWKTLQAGDAQIIRAGSGISHSEALSKGARLFQIWLDPNLQKTMTQPATYDDYPSDSFLTKQDGDWRIKTYAGQDAPLQLEAEVEIQQIDFSQTDKVLQLSKDKIYSFYVLDGYVTFDGQAAETDSFVVLYEAEKVRIESPRTTRLFMIASPAKLSYPTYQERMQAQMRGTS